MNLEIFLTEHTPEDSLPKKSIFWAMSFPEQIEVPEINEQVVMGAVQKIFSLNAPDKDRIPRGVYFRVCFQEKDLFRGHIDSGGQIDSLVKV
ncbi:MAG: hypothetical protein Q7K38_02895 [Candidatus Wildermuthbacteria bacterium]|nr:hypothetical protein [Candidatus Wildermuthbacteria bacterium]